LKFSVGFWLPEKTQSTPSINKITNSKLEIRNSKQKGKTENTNFKTFKNAGEVLIGRFWILRIEILKLFRISIFEFEPHFISAFNPGASRRDIHC